MFSKVVGRRLTVVPKVAAPKSTRLSAPLKVKESRNFASVSDLNPKQGETSTAYFERLLRNVVRGDPDFPTPALKLIDKLLSGIDEAKLKALDRNSPTYGAELLKLVRHSPQAQFQFDELIRVAHDHFIAPIEPEPVRVTVTGASGQIGYALLFRIASGAMLGPRQPVHLQLLELTPAMKALEGVVMELKDCAFPLLRGITATDNVNKAFEGSDYSLLVGAKPRSKGMERADLLKENAKIFAEQGKALNDNANRNVKVLVVGNPANTNAMITSHFAPKINPRNITAMTQLDHNRGLAQLADKLNCKISDISRFIIWGNHSATQYPDISHVQIKTKNGQQWAKEIIDEKWYRDTFIPTVQQRGAAVINARGASSAASAANAAIDHMRNWALGTGSSWTSFAVPSNGEYGVDKGIWFSYPVVCPPGDYSVVPDVPISPFSAERMEATRKELVQERDAVSALLK